LIENTHDRPYLKAGVGPEIAAAMAVIGAEVRTGDSAAAWHPGLAGANASALALRSHAARALCVLRASCLRT